VVDILEAGSLAALAPAACADSQHPAAGAATVHTLGVAPAPALVAGRSCVRPGSVLRPLDVRLSARTAAGPELTKRSNVALSAALVAALHLTVDTRTGVHRLDADD
jgi:hypothetical protein